MSLNFTTIPADVVAKVDEINSIGDKELRRLAFLNLFMDLDVVVCEDDNSTSEDESVTLL